MNYYVIEHSAKGTSWEKKDHKYVEKIVNGGKTLYRYAKAFVNTRPIIWEISELLEHKELIKEGYEATKRDFANLRAEETYEWAHGIVKKDSWYHQFGDAGDSMKKYDIERAHKQGYKEN